MNGKFYELEYENTGLFFFLAELKPLPEMTPLTVHHDLADTECVYTSETMKSYRRLDSCNYFLSGTEGNI